MASVGAMLGAVLHASLLCRQNATYWLSASENCESRALPVRELSCSDGEFLGSVLGGERPRSAMTLCVGHAAGVFEALPPGRWGMNSAAASSSSTRGLKSADVIYVCSPHGKFGYFDSTYFQYTPISTTLAMCTGLSFDERGVLYALSYLSESLGQNVFIVDPATGHATLQGPLNGFVSLMGGFAVRGGNAYGNDIVEGFVYTVNVTTRVITHTGNNLWGYAPYINQVFGWSGSRLLAAMNPNRQPGARQARQGTAMQAGIYSVDAATGVWTFLNTHAGFTYDRMTCGNNIAQTYMVCQDWNTGTVFKTTGVGDFDVLAYTSIPSDYIVGIAVGPAPSPPPPRASVGLSEVLPAGGAPAPVGPSGTPAAVPRAPTAVPGAPSVPVVAATATVEVTFTTVDCGNAAPAERGMQVACDGVSGGQCRVTSRCALAVQGTQRVVVTAVMPSAGVAALVQQIASGSVAGVPPKASVSVDGAAVPLPPVAATAYLRARMVDKVQCVVEVGACAALLAASGFAVGTRTLSCVCTAASRATGPMVVTIAPADGVNATQFGAAVARAFGACVKLYAPPPAGSTTDMFVAEMCPAAAVTPAAGGHSKKGLLGLLGLLGLIPLACCLLLLCALARRRRRKAADVMFAVYNAGLPPHPAAAVVAATGAMGGCVVPTAFAV